MKKILLIAAPAIFGLGLASQASADMAQAKALYEANCVSCHDSSVYTRPNHRVQNMDQLHAQLERCDQALGAKLTAQQKDELAQYLNKEFYKFN